MRFASNRLLTFLIFSRFFILFFPWLTLTLLEPGGNHSNFVDFTNSSWNRWDARHYMYLAQNWYTSVGDPANFIVFFPLYPILLKAFFSLVGASVIGAITLSLIFFFAGCYYFYKLILIDFDKTVAKRAVISLAIFPTAFFFNAPYTESLFLLVFSITMLSARTENWVLAGVFSGFGTITRPFGILLLPAILTEWFFSKKRSLKQLPVLISPSLIAGLSYLYLNNHIYGNPLQFQKVLETNWHKHLVSPIQSISDSWRIAMGGGLTNYAIFVGWGEALTITIAWVLIPLVFKYLRPSWAVFYLLSVVFLSSTSFILSTPRYILSIPVFFVLVALAEKNETFRNVWRFTSIGLLVCLSILFTKGQWAF